MKILPRFVTRNAIYYIFLLNIVLFIASSILVRSYFQNGLPYYDSVGSYWNMFSIMNTTNMYGFSEGIKQASAYPLSWLQAYYAVLVAPVLPKSPQALISLNFLCLFAFQYAIFSFFKNRKYTIQKSFLISLLPFFPNAVVGWEGGIIDMRRDSSMYSLLGASFFLMWDYLITPTILKGVILGFFIGLAQWSRGNAFPYIIIVLLPPFISGIYWKLYKENKRVALSMFVPPFLSFLIFAVPFYLVNVSQIYSKYVFGSWGFGVNRIYAAKTFVQSLSNILIGSSNDLKKIHIIIFGVIFLAAAYLFQKKYITFRIHDSQHSLKIMFCLSGIGVIIGMLFFNAVLLGVAPFSGIFPHFPAIIGVTAVMSFFLASFQYSKKKIISPRQKTLFLLYISIFLLILNIYRIYSTMPPLDPKLRNQALKAAKTVVFTMKDKSVAYLWLDHIHVHDLNFYITQSGGKPINAGSYLKPGVDTEMPPAKDKSIKEQQEKFSEGIRIRDIIVVSQDPKAYDNPRGFFFMLMYGKPVIEELLNDKNYKIVYQFSNGQYPFVVLQKI